MSEADFFHDTLKSSVPDTMLSTIHLANKAERNFYNHLSNNGSAADAARFEFHPSLYSEVSLPAYKLWLKKHGDLRYFKSNKRFSEIIATLGPRKEQALKVFHSQNILSNWSAGLDLLRSGSNGYLLNGKTFLSSFSIFSWYHTRNHRYHILANTVWETIKNQVNGGITNDSIYDHTRVGNLSLQGLPVNLSGAENHVRSRIYSLNQFFDLGPKEKFDTGISVFKYRPAFRINLMNRLERYSFAYQDGTTDSLYYPNTYYFDTNKDSLYSRNFITDITFSSFPKEGGVLNNFYLEAGVTHQWMEYRQRSIDTTYENFGCHLTIRTRESGSGISLGNKAEFVTDKNAGRWRDTFFLKIPFSTIGAIIFSGEFGESNPSVLFQKYYSNHFIWENNFNSINYSMAGISFSSPQLKTEAGVTYTTLKNYVYLDNEAVPEQFPGNLTILKAYLKKNFTLGRFHFDNSIWYQETNEVTIIHLPELCSYHSLYYSVSAFKKAVQFETGIDLSYKSSYYSNAFMPATGMFYLQDEIKTNGYPVMNLFFNFRIKSADLFVKFDNVGDNFIDDGYYLTPHYPMRGRTFMFGIRWRFYDQ